MRIKTFAGLVLSGVVMAGLAASAAAFGRLDLRLAAPQITAPRATLIAIMNPVCAQWRNEVDAGEAAEAKIDDLLPPAPKTSWEANSPQAKALCDGFKEVASHMGKAAALSDKALEVCMTSEGEISREEVEQTRKSAAALDKNLAAACGAK